MLKKTYDALVKQLKINMDSQDFHNDSYTNLWIDEKVVFNSYSYVEFHHPQFILNGNQENVFPERVQLDVDKEFEPAIAMVLTFGMKENKQELERFKSMDDFADFRELKDLGIRFYAIDFGTDVNAAATKCIKILKNVFDGENANSIQVTTCNGLGEQLCTSFISPQQQEKQINGYTSIPVPMINQQTKNVVCPYCGNTLYLPKELENSDYLKCLLCQNDFANPLKPIAKNENGLSKNVAKWGCLLFVIILALIAIFIPNDNTSGACGPGESIILTEETFGAVDEKTYDEMNEARLANDKIGLLQLMYDGRVEHLKPGTQGLVLKLSMWKIKIRLNNGNAYWVATEHIKKATN